MGSHEPQGLKAHVLGVFIGTAKAVPLPKTLSVKEESINYLVLGTPPWASKSLRNKDLSFDCRANL